MLGPYSLQVRPAPVATLPPRRGPQSVRFSTARSVRFSVAIDNVEASPVSSECPRMVKRAIYQCHWISAPGTFASRSGQRLCDGDSVSGEQRWL